MADSDNSRTLPIVTRRRLLSTSAAWLAAQVGDDNAALHPAYDPPDGGDQTLMLWREWSAAHEQVEKFCRRQQRLETALIAAVGFPQVDLAVPDQECVVAAFSVKEIDHRFGDAPEYRDAKMRAKAVFAERQAAWDSLDEGLGYSRAKQAEEEAFAMRAERLEVLFMHPAHSVAGAAAKLHALVTMAEEDGSRHEFPWPQIRAVMADLISLGNGPSGI
ncbi:hypothetical protein KX729_22275 [Rhizobium sp. XQZ8]|uniref:hypothetical protein n=1 Tax=Rhizobium populisoli TaxID=2859785 RepID=UPI001CA572C7|nr:hypothetical protein [Rhizobium populisoli]MBW6424192.1 hypothetical protein [Rhizobium populisoli]